ncbi:MAG: DUF1553 domain-containing protein [Candidatus Poribacteria bacterium]
MQKKLENKKLNKSLFKKTLNWLMLSVLFAGWSTAKIDFDRQIRPIFSDRCYACHGPDNNVRKANLRLDKMDSLFEQRNDIYIVNPNHPEQSELYRRIISTDPAHVMPRPEFKRPLAQEDITLIKQWIEEGAEYQKHWSLIPIKDVPVPELKNSTWPKNQLDQFVLERLKQENLQPSTEASKERLIRRLSFDIIGLPPTVKEIDVFLADKSPSAYENLVDLLLASPRFGERMASIWLDLSRYADSYGYQSDVHRDMSPWRDWVIKAFNTNLPYDQFVTWQLAGDLLPEPTREQQLATAFNRLHRQTNEGGSVEEEYRVEYVSDRTHTFGTSFLGLTIECAQCHNHKYDPISQKDYYSLSAFFNNIDESGLYSHFTNAVPTPTLLMTDSEAEGKLTELEQQVIDAESTLEDLVSQRKSAFTEWAQNPPETAKIQGLTGNYSFDDIVESNVPNHADSEKPGTIHDNPKIISGRRGKGLQLSGENSVVFKDVGAFDRANPFSIALWMQTPDYKDRSVVFHRSRSWTDAGSRGYQLLIEDGKLSASLIHFWPGNAIRVRTKQQIPKGAWIHVVVTYDGSSRGNGLRLYLNGMVADTQIVRDNLYKTIIGGGEIHLTIGQRFRDRGFKNGSVDEFQVFDRCLTPLEITYLHSQETLDIVSKDLIHNQEKQEDYYQYYLVNYDEIYQNQLTELMKRRDEYNKAIDPVSEIMTMIELSKRRPTYVLKRGAYDDRGEQVAPDTPASILPFSKDAPKNRLGLARWLINPKNPLTARVAVNRYWQIFFNRGIVPTPEDFGSQGERPSHPLLLDWLAKRFVDSGWNQKEMIKLIVMSATYRQSSVPSPELLEKDPENRLFARGPRARLTAEMIRDNALYVSGLLVDKVGGASVKPYQPAGLWKEKSGRTYEHDKGDGLYRRSLYTFWKRTSPPPSLMIFDAAKRDVCVVKRRETNTPMQALLLLNDTQFVEASLFLGQRMLKEGGETLPEQIQFVFRLTTGRHPTEKEIEILKKLYQEQQRIFEANPDQAEKLLATGEKERDLSLPSTQAATATTVASTMLNFDDTITKR